MSSPRAVLIARVLVVVWAVLVWNVVFDHVVVVAGRNFIVAAQAGARAGHFANMDDWMKPAVSRGAWIATAAGAAILIVGLAAVRSAKAFALRDRPTPR